MNIIKKLLYLFNKDEYPEVFIDKGKYGLRKGKEILLKPIYTSITSFFNGCAIVRAKSKYFYVNRYGKRIGSLYDICLHFNYKRFAQAQRNNIWYTINKKGEVIQRSNTIK